MDGASTQGASLGGAVLLTAAEALAVEAKAPDQAQPAARGEAPHLAGAPSSPRSLKSRYSCCSVVHSLAKPGPWLP
jgi:hypothetical protein